MSTNATTAQAASCLDGRVAIITGANSGIGRGIAEAFAQVGAKVVVSGRTEARNAEVVEAITKAGGEAMGVCADVTREEDIVALVDQTVEKYGRLDICVANSGGIGDGPGAGPITEMETKEWRQVLSLNLDGVFILYREALRHMIPAGSGALISVSSVASIRSTGSNFHYAAAKGGVNSLTLSLADYLGPRGIRINTIVPGFVESAATAPALAVESIRRGIEKRIPMRRIGVPADVGALAVFLASDQSSYITGGNFVIDGGQSQNMVSDAPAT